MPPAATASVQLTPEPSDTGQQLAELLLREGVLDASSHERAVRVHSKLRAGKTLFGVLVKLDLVNEADMLAIIRRRRPSLRIGELLVELGYISVEQLRQALQLQAQQIPRAKLGELLIARHLIGQKDLTRMLASQLGFESVEPEIGDCDSVLLKRLIVKSARRFGFLPLQRDGDEATVAFVDPNDQAARTEAARMLAIQVRPIMVSPATLERALAAFERQRGSGAAAETASGDLSTAPGRVNRMIAEGIRDGASDIHIEPLRDHVRVRFRVDGVLRGHSEFTTEELGAVVSRIKIMAEADIAERRRHQDGRIDFEDPFSGVVTDLRVSFYVTVHGECVVIRILNQNSKILPLSGIGMVPSMLERFRNMALDTPSGVVLVTGPTGSGKTSTLYSCVQHLNDATCSIITAEDPVEFQLDGISQCSISTKSGRTFEESLRHVVRQDPDVIVLGEIRDQTTAEGAIQAALTGHKVLTTFHTEDSVGALLRLANMGIEPFLISSTVVCVVAQRLLRRVCPECAAAIEPNAQDCRLLGWSRDDARTAQFQVGIGCERCHFSGYRGRIAVFEVLLLNEPVREAILLQRTSDQIRKISLESSNLVTLLEDGLLKAAQGKTTLAEIRRTLPRLGKPRPLEELRRFAGKTT